MNESLSFRTILTKVTFVTASVASLMLDSTCFVLGLPFGTFILAHVLVKCHLEAFVLDTPVCQTGQSRFHRLASKLLLLDRQLYCDIFLCNQITSEISYFVF
jgi:hypothetical protein